MKILEKLNLKMQLMCAIMLVLITGIVLHISMQIIGTTLTVVIVCVGMFIYLFLVAHKIDKNNENN